MFDDYTLDPTTVLALLCLITAFGFWDNDVLFFLFATMAMLTRFMHSY